MSGYKVGQFSEAFTFGKINKKSPEKKKMKNNEVKNLRTEKNTCNREIDIEKPFTKPQRYFHKDFNKIQMQQKKKGQFDRPLHFRGMSPTKSKPNTHTNTHIRFDNVADNSESTNAVEVVEIKQNSEAKNWRQKAYGKKRSPKSESPAKKNDLNVQKSKKREHDHMKNIETENAEVLVNTGIESTKKRKKSLEKKETEMFQNDDIPGNQTAGHKRRKKLKYSAKTKIMGNDEVIDVNSSVKVKELNFNKLKKKKHAEEDSNAPNSPTHSKIDMKRSKGLKLQEMHENSLNADSDSRKQSNIEGHRSKTIEELEEELQRTVFVGNVPNNVSHKDLKNLFKVHGKVETARIRSVIPARSSTDKSKRLSAITQTFSKNCTSTKGYVVFKQLEDAEKALTMSGFDLNGHHLSVNLGEETIYEDKQSIFVGNLPYDVEDEMLWRTFRNCGTIKSVRVVRDKETGIGKGFGFVLFEDVESVKKAIQQNEKEHFGRSIRVKQSSNRKSPNTRPREPFPFSIDKKPQKIGTSFEKWKESEDKSEKFATYDAYKRVRKKLIRKQRREKEKKKVASIFKKLKRNQQ